MSNTKSHILDSNGHTSYLSHAVQVVVVVVSRSSCTTTLPPPSAPKADVSQFTLFRRKFSCVATYAIYVSIFLAENGAGVKK